MMRCIYLYDRPPTPPAPPRHQELKAEAGTPPAPADLLRLAEEWEHRARCKFESARVQPDEAARRFIEHGATCYFNCAQQLRIALAEIRK